MNLLDGLGASETINPGHSGQWRLSRVELLNWGTFDGHHTVPIARKGHLITGASGSGKSSLLDAIAVVLTPDKWVKFNAAALDGTSRSGDRNKVSYVRGAWSKEADAAYDRAVSTYLRKAATWSGILLRFDDGRSDPVVLVRLFHLKGTTTDPADLKDSSVIFRRDLTLPDLAPFAARGLDMRKLKAELDPVVATSGSHGPFYTRLRSLLGITSDNALNLLHKTQAAKNLGSLDALFRTFMLDTPGTFTRVENAVDQFRELNESHSHVVDLREQAAALGTVDESAVLFDAAETEMLAGRRLSDCALPFTAQWKRSLADVELQAAKQEQARAQRAADAARVASEQAESLHASAKQRLDQRGGAELNHLRARVDEARVRAGEVTAARALLGDKLDRVGVPMPETPEELEELVAIAQAETTKQAPDAIDFDVNDALSRAQAEVRRLEGEIAALRGKRSNVPPDLLVARRRIAGQLKLPEQALPFAGELIDVRAEFAEWTGAIERVLAPVSTAMLVRDDLLTRVRQEVDSIHLETRLVIDAVALHVDPPAAVRDERSVIHRVRVADGPFTAYLNRRLGDEFDYVCVAHPDELDGVDRGVTVTGLVKRSRRRYEKNDRYRVDDRGRWVLGTDNAEKFEHLLRELGSAKQAAQGARERFDRAQGARDEMITRRTVFADIVRVSWAGIDIAAADRRISGLEGELSILTAPDSEMAEAVRAEKDARVAAAKLREEMNQADVEARQAIDEQKRLVALIDELATEAPTVVDETDAADLKRRFREVRRSISLGNIDSVSAQVMRMLGTQVQEADARARRAESDFVRQATHFVDRWKAASAELTPTIEDRGGFRALREGILSRGLPEYEAKFLTLLRERSRDMIIHLRDELMSAPRRVTERIEPVNESLGRSPYDRGRFLDILVKTRRSGEVEEFLADLKRIVEGNWAEEDLAGAEERFAVLSKVMRRLDSSDNADRAWRARVLDTREHVSFLAQEKDAAGRVVAVHDSSAGLSGGQRQKLVIFCLAAALRFQLADRDDLVPSYGTVVLDEAFDKADAQYTRMAMDIFREFGFHMILATPQKLLQTLEPYIGAVTSVSNPTRDQSLLANVVIERAQ